MAKVAARKRGGKRVVEARAIEGTDLSASPPAVLLLDGTEDGERLNRDMASLSAIRNDLTSMSDHLARLAGMAGSTSQIEIAAQKRLELENTVRVFDAIKAAVPDISPLMARHIAAVARAIAEACEGAPARLLAASAALVEKDIWAQTERAAQLLLMDRVTTRNALAVEARVLLSSIFDKEGRTLSLDWNAAADAIIEAHEHRHGKRRLAARFLQLAGIAAPDTSDPTAAAAKAAYRRRLKEKSVAKAGR